MIYEVIAINESQLLNSNIRDLYFECYSVFHGLINRPLIRNDAFDFWVRNYGKSRNKSRIIYGAFSNGKFVGFIEGSLKNSPSTAPPELVGFVNLIYVTPEFRRSGLARELYQTLEKWFRDNGVNSVELQVVRGNDLALRFWSFNNFEQEMISMRKNGVNTDEI
ncbi:GNAT family N-acetyltransferase [Zhengella sp. ZM62]|uniref:GNAT family N-acetyltransferase n=1 Tax=Zhengella sedimenti TaxID=3390035 RepID=UPI0039759462